MAGIYSAYLSGAAADLYGGSFARAEDRARAVARRSRPLDPRVLAAVEAQNARLAPSAAREANLRRLRDGAAAVVTGQQVGLFLGPLFTVHKAATAFRVAEALEQQTGSPVVPVFWLQTEDHDLPEIASCHLPRSGSTPRTVEVPVSSDGRVSVAHCTLPPEVAGCLGLLRDELGNLPHAEAHLALLSRHYRPGARWAEAFAAVLSELFAEQGLVFLDPRDPALAPFAAAVHRRALVDAGPLSEAMLAHHGVLEARGHAPSIHVRAGAPLSFFHPEGPEGPRYRLEPAGPGRFREVGGAREHRVEDLLATLEREPLCFSTSALLRPIFQDVLLPTAAYVGGPAEVAYFAQLPPLYRAFGLEMPRVVPRAHLTVVEERVDKLLGKLGLTPADAVLSTDALLRRAAPADTDAALSAQGLEAQLAAGFEDVLRAAVPKDVLGAPGIDAALEKTLGTVRMAATKLAEKYEKARLQQDRARVEEVARVKAALYPGDVPQERFFGLSYFAARYGERAFVQAVLRAVVPFDPSFRDVRP